jgi:unsaturated rhamnogalacturonyl hydrolase
MPFVRLRFGSIKFALVCVLASCSLAMGQPDGPLNPAEIAAKLKTVADWQLANPMGDNALTEWVRAPLYDGLLALSTTTGDPRYLSALLRYGRQVGWATHFRKYHADDIAVAHAWLDIYRMDPSRKERLLPTQKHLDAIMAAPRTEELDMRDPSRFPGVSETDRWTWCDALYMAPPTFVRLAEMTGDRSYLEFMDREFRFTYDRLYDPQEKLFYRDATFFDQKTLSGKKVFWSRGNGWVYGGLALILERLPGDHLTRSFYVKLFQEMTPAILAAQQPDGLWYPSLLDPAQIAIGETSGSVFFVYGLAWGVNHGLLSREACWSAIEKGWLGLSMRIGEDGYVGFVQRVGVAPDSVGPTSRQDYGTGAFLLAGCEVLKALGAAAPSVEPRRLLALAESLPQSYEPKAYKVAFRIYGPALRDSIEDSGIDIWCKRVSYPVVEKWYAQDLAGGPSYHEDHGEGYDGYKVANSRGCGGLGLWVDDRIVTSDVYMDPSINDTRSDYLSFTVLYRYPEVNGRKIVEHRAIVLRLGERVFEVSARFTENRKPVANLPVVIGLYAQSAQPKVLLEAADGVMVVWDKVDGEGLGTGIAIDPLRVDRMLRQPFGKNAEHALCVVRTDEKGELRYRSGFAWTRAGDIVTVDAWRDYLKARNRASFQPVVIR